jgi:ribosomal protein S18 acetylase RimI-like enzyme
MSICFRIATKSDVPNVASILTECSEYVQNMGMGKMWPIPFPEDQVASTIDKNETWVVERVGTEQIAATFRLVWSDPIFWGSQPPVAGYLHKLAVRRAFAHQDMGTRIVEFAEEQVRQRGREYLRLDCMASNSFIVSYYQARGFRPVKLLVMNICGEVQGIKLMEKLLTGD